jgi:glycosyltransferase involved in cell wall biosynthesis
MALYVGHVSYESELSLLVQALPRVVAASPEIRVVIIGSGPGLSRLRDFALQKGVGEHVIFAGWVAPPEVAVFLAAANIALYPYRDSLINRAKSPSKITAYMAMGKPIVASSVGENVAYLDDGRAGVLVEPGNAAAFADGMIELLGDRERAEMLGKRAEERIWERYDWDSLVERTECAYQLAASSGEPQDVKPRLN